MKNEEERTETHRRHAAWRGEEDTTIQIFQPKVPPLQQCIVLGLKLNWDWPLESRILIFKMGVTFSHLLISYSSWYTCVTESRGVDKVIPRNFLVWKS